MAGKDPSKRPGRRAVATEIRSMLFFDLAGWSKLKPPEIARYLDEGLSAVAELLEPASSTNSWGDGIVATFGSARVAAECALDLRDLFLRGTTPGVPEGLVPRISLHLGEVIIAYNPIIAREDVFGDAVHLTARLEPVTPVGQVFCTAQFAAALADIKGLGPATTPCGELVLPKGFGKIPVHVVHGANEKVQVSAPKDKLRESMPAPSLRRFDHLPEPYWLNEGKPDKGTNRLFEARIEDAFPGIRGVKEFERPGDALERLSILLASPLQFRALNGAGAWYPFWWWRGGSHNAIETFTVVNPERCIIDIQELRIRRIVAHRSDQFWHNFVYVETAPDEPIGIYPQDAGNVERSVAESGFACEEYGLFGSTPISREELDDGSAVIGGKVVSLGGNGVLRRRYLSRYNFVIAAQFSPFNGHENEPVFGRILSQILRGEADVGDLAGRVAATGRYGDR